MNIKEFTDVLRHIIAEWRETYNDRNKLISLANSIQVKARNVAASTQFAQSFKYISGFEFKNGFFIIKISEIKSAEFPNFFVFSTKIIDFINQNQIQDETPVYMNGIELTSEPVYNRISKEIIMEYGNINELDESILDLPKTDLDTDVWKKDGNEYRMTDVCRARIAKILKWLTEKHELPDLRVFIIGSITSNSYSQNSDIDLNICSSAITDKDVAADLCSIVKKEYIEFSRQNEEDVKIGSHPFELYMQFNPYRCLASVGCYDFFEEKWIVGPEFKPLEFDPTAEYYDKGNRGAKEEMRDVRNTILDIYELAIVATKSHDNDFKEKKFKTILSKLKHAKKIFSKIHDDRAGYDGEIDSAKTAEKLRGDKRRNQADAKYKFLDKFGYVQILRDYAQLQKDSEKTTPDQDQYMLKIIQTVKQNLDADKTLVDSEQTEQLFENIALDGIQKISFPVKEWAALKKLPEITTTRIGDECDKYEIGDIVAAPWKRLYRIQTKQIVQDLIDHPYYEDLTEKQTDMLLACDRMAVLKLTPVDEMDESVKQLLTVFALAGLLAVPGLFTQKALADEFQKIPRRQLRFGTPAVNKAMEDAALEKKQWNGLSFTNMTNLLASISYNEGMLDWLKTGDDNCLIAVLNSIDNRSAGDPTHYTAEIMRKSQYISVKHINTRSLSDCTDSKFKKWDPRQAAAAVGQQISPRQAECWKLCNQFAVQLLKKQLPSVIGDRNMLANQKIDDEDKWEAWGKYCDLRVGNQMYGYQKRHDGYINYNVKKPAHLNHGKPTGKYVVQSGDTLGKIAEKYKTTIMKLMTKNQIKDPNKIRVGQTLVI